MRFFAPLSTSFRTFGLSTYCSAAFIITLLKFCLLDFHLRHLLLSVTFLFTVFAAAMDLCRLLFDLVLLCFQVFLLTQLYLIFQLYFKFCFTLFSDCSSSSVPLLPLYILWIQHCFLFRLYFKSNFTLFSGCPLNSVRFSLSYNFPIQLCFLVQLYFRFCFTSFSD